MASLRSRDPFGAALEGLRARIRHGELPPGEPLVVLDLARSLNLSATPIREALAYLAGEGLIDGRREKSRGYATWGLTPSDLADLYRLHQNQALFGVSEATRRGTSLSLRAELAREPSASPTALVDATEALFGQVARAAGSVAARRAHRTIADRLHFARRFEHKVLGDAPSELIGIAELEAGGSLLAQALRTYHRRRIAEVERLVALMSGGDD